MLMVDAAFTVIALPSAAAPPNSAVIPAVRDWVGVLSPGSVPLTMIVVPGRVVIWAVPFPSAPAKMPLENLPCTLIVPLW